MSFYLPPFFATKKGSKQILIIFSNINLCPSKAISAREKRLAVISPFSADNMQKGTMLIFKACTVCLIFVVVLFKYYFNVFDSI